MADASAGCLADAKANAAVAPVECEWRGGIVVREGVDCNSTAYRVLFSGVAGGGGCAMGVVF